MTQDHDEACTLKVGKPTFWLSPSLASCPGALESLELTAGDIRAAAERLSRFRPLLATLFPDVRDGGGVVESPLWSVPELAARVLGDRAAHGALMMKADHALPIAGSVKARGGLYEVLVFAERLAVEEGLMSRAVSSLTLAGPAARKLFSEHTITVGSTGNLGLCIGIVAHALGFQCVVHMSSESKGWKRNRLLKHGVAVRHHEGDYLEALQAGREFAAQSLNTHFIDDENSVDMFLGYSVAALRLGEQLRRARVRVDAEHPLFVYIPCGVGGAPGGISFGLKHVYGDAVHCFFAEPVQSPAMLLQLRSGSAHRQSVHDLGLSNITEADGLAAPSASLLAARMVRDLVSGIYTVTDEILLRWVHAVDDAVSERLEPSATAGFAGPGMLINSDAGRRYLKAHGLERSLSQSTHLIWTTGGSLMPDSEFQAYRIRGEELRASDSMPRMQ